MIKKYSDDPNVEAAAQGAQRIVYEVLTTLPKADSFDYGGHDLRLGEYEVCTRCTSAIAEAQQAHKQLLKKAEQIEDSTVREHVELVAELFRLESEVAKVRAELHNGRGSEGMLNEALGFIFDRQIHDDITHSHHRGA